MFKKLLLLLALPMLLLACTTSDEPAAEPVTETQVETVIEETAAESSEMAEDDAAMEEEMAEEDHSDADMEEGEMAEEDAAMAEDDMAEEAMEEEAMEEEGEAMAEEEMASETTFVVDPAASVLTWTGSKPIGDSHTGTVQLIDGTLVADGETFISGGFNIDMTTITDRDGSRRLEGHLKSDDFFGVENFPTATVEILSATPTADGYDVVANLTIKEITNEITFPVTVNIADSQMTGTASIVFDRSLWDVRYGSGSFFDGLGNDLIDDEISMEVEIVANS